MRRHLVLLAVLFAGCTGSADRLGVTRSALGDTVYHLTQANTVQLRSIDFQVDQQIVDGNLRFALCLKHNSVYNAALGVDHLLYEADGATYPVLSVSEEGWSVNYDGTQADGFGAFASHKNSNPAGHGGLDCAAPLVFTLKGDPTGGTNGPLEIAVHVRFDGSCSGWVSNRLLGSLPGSEPNCQRLPDCKPPPPVCSPVAP